MKADSSIWLLVISITALTLWLYSYWRSLDPIREWITPLATVLIAILTAGYVVTSYYQLGVIQQQLTDAEIRDAASVSIRNLIVDGFPDHVVVSYEAMNEGNTRADVFLAVVEFGAILLEDEVSFFNRPDAFGIFNPNENGYSIEAHHGTARISVETTNFPLPGNGFWSADIMAKLPTRKDYLEGRKLAYFAVIAAYLDVFGKTHRTTDCVIYHPNIGFQPYTAQHDRHQ